MENEDVQKAVLIYNDRLLSYKKMKKIDAIIDKDPTEQLIIDLAETRNRNLLCFRELSEYNETGKFLNRHPLIGKFGIKKEYQDLLKKDSDEFLEKYFKAASYVNRYRTYLNNRKRTEEQHVKDAVNLKKHQDIESLMKEVLDESNGN